MKMNNFKCIESLEENPVEVFLEVTAILLKLVDNVLLYPSNPKYRKLRLENKLVSTVIMPSIGAMECLFELGFQEDDDALLLPPESTSMEKLTCFRTEVSNRRNKYLKKSGESSSDKLSETQPIVSVERQSTPQPEAASQPQSSVVKSTTTSVNPLLASLHAWSTRVLQYEQEDTKLKALSVVPLSDISERVQSRMRLYQQQAMKDGQPLNESSIQETVFFMELMDWFKNDFFTWVNSPKCPTCDCDTQFLEMSSSPKEMVHSDRVEVYKCGKCAAKVLFPRINDPSKLLDTRRGRCGEWANAFTALCRALGWDARFVLDLTDHVWTEVYFKSEGRWVHCDPCECALDKPLLYEKGWGKNLTYIVAFSCEDVQDVTWRYSANHSAVLARRNLCTEQQLLQTIRDLNQIRQANLSTLRKKVLAKRTLVELVQLMFPAAGSEGDDQGRQSGSLAWRLARSEALLAQADNRACVWTPTSQEVEAKKMVVSYCSGTDEYSRGLSGDKIKGWRAGVFSAENMWRKEEKDWKMAYLCRTESSTEGRVSWKIDLSSCGLEVDQVDVLCLSTTFHSGKVTWLLCSGDKCIRITDGKLKTSELRGSTNLTLSASLSGGEGSVSWQHAQLFRQKVDAADASFYLCVTFTKLNKC